ncbi:restriction endonuclease subunit S [Klebsiella pneumoniae]|uniref:Restriction modification system DNA specificity domain protein n=2 Tax=Klebsiella pneumoniae TaxID=573 RepID=A0A0H3GYB1_KLEPH|nr:restriction endonuclease subunit S [Klebsiella pneumoniae]YP_005220916.1 Restriction modification system DNA specificity domain protein [Klebsiella pneumoniae subsp. pneumoniae HS11286]UMX55945.1 restriction endonuclease subunit S [Escherichia coli]HDU4120159.1 restriction endonuclease subunit S [Klebsiella pneumoniae subsp. pneumoniae]AEW92017.1 Restriction modification system DNA specificity domain protein [Klebsiella pneumoniae subsp. pneumoniae HS11286]ASC26274.1 restriction endonucleas
MSALSYLEKLLNGVDIQWKTIGEVTLRTSNIKWREATRSYRYVDLTSVDIETKKIIETTEVTANNAPSRAQKLIEENDVIFATTRPTQQRFCLIDGEYSDEVASTGFCVLRAKQDEVLPKWIWHWISTSYFKKYVEENQSGSAYPAISDAKVKECYIPVPCPENPGKSLAIQSEIVRILDKFTALTAELTAELTARKKQYNYYRDQLLSFEGGSVEWKSLGEVAIITIGAFVRKDKQNPDADYPVYNGGRTPTGYYEDFNNDGDKIIVSARGANAGFVNKSSTPYWAGNSCYSISVRSTEQLHWMYVYYYLKQSETKLTGIQQKGGIPAVSKKQMEDLLLPIPSKSEQVRIVTILDKFDTLTSSITEGLPREIELRQKQYEYYRDLLFSFPKPEIASH